MAYCLLIVAGSCQLFNPLPYSSYDITVTIGAKSYLSVLSVVLYGNPRLKVSSEKILIEAKSITTMSFCTLTDNMIAIQRETVYDRKIFLCLNDRMKGKSTLLSLEQEESASPISYHCTHKTAQNIPRMHEKPKPEQARIAGKMCVGSQIWLVLTC